MQQAEWADSSRHPGASPGKHDDLSALDVVLEIVHLDRFNTPGDQANVIVSRIGTLLRATSEAVEEAADERGYYHREPGYERRRLKHISGLLDLLDDEVRRLNRFVEAVA